MTEGRKGNIMALTLTLRLLLLLMLMLLLPPVQDKDDDGGYVHRESNMQISNIDAVAVIG